MPRVRFLTDRAVIEYTPAGVPVEIGFAAGQVYELPASSCERWIRRGAAVEVAAPAADQDAPAKRRGRPRKG